ncbi:MAG: TonB-dependent receptor [Azoarcus sp.]|nr:TonB-dependent receptor [Azoarcus sp.]
MPHPLLRPLACTLAMTSAVPALSDELHADPFAQDMPVVLTGSRLAQSPLDAPAPVTIIDREMISASGFTEIHDLMRLVPGFLVADWPNGSPTVANHGLGDAFDRRIKVLIDGRAVNDPLWGNTMWQDLPVRVDDIDRIEVVRGPHGAAYGANAFQGVINIITRHPATESGTTVISRLGRDGFHDHGVRINGGAGSAIDWRLTASRRGARNFESISNNEGDVFSQESIRRSVVNLQASTQLTARDELRLQLGIVDGVDDRGYPANSEEAPEWPIRDEDVRTHYLHGAWTRSFAADSELTVQFYHQAHRRRVAWVIEDGGRSIPTDLDTDTARNEFEVQYSGRMAPRWHFLVGGGVRQDSVRSRRYFDRGGALRATYWQGFGSLTWRATDTLSVNLGGTFEEHEYSGTLFSPRMAVNWALSPLSALRVSAGKSYRAPSLMESHARETIRYQDTIARRLYNSLQKIDPEEVVHLELGYVARIPQYGLSLDARVFQDRYDGYLDDEVCRYRPPPRSNCADLGFATPPGFSADPLSTSTYYFLNLGRATVRGTEFTLDWKRPGWGRAILTQSFTRVHAGSQLEEENVDRSAPRSATSLLLIKDLPHRWRASLGYYHTQPVHWLNDGGEMGNQDRVDLKIARAFGPHGSDNEVALTAQSLGGRYPDFDAEKFRHEPQIFLSVRATW